ncbi:MAG TPA: FeoA family protein [Steroidobacteraceae bacterium]|jgi:Fe2+ transport system protein FeoA|nr:FeoA family protein [Steroidobacteraceae bacterium]
MDSCRAWHQAALANEPDTDVICSLAQLHKGARGVVSAVASSSTVRRLMELGFVPGERIEVIEEVRPGGDPIAVRIGTSMFALRRREAQAVMVKLEQP